MRLKSIVAACLAFGFGVACHGAASAQEEIRLWPGKAPGTESWKEPEQTVTQGRGRRVTNVSDPTVTVFLPPRDKANGTAIVIAPGGGMRALSIDSGGTSVARWLNQRGFAAFVLKYRVRQQPSGTGRGGEEEGGLPRRPPPVGSATTPMAERPEMVIRNGNADPAQDHPEMARVYRMAVADAGEAMRLIRRNAGKWGVDPHKVGIMGFSAGGGVTVGSGLMAAGDGYPDFVISAFGPSLMDVNVPPYAAPLFLVVKQDHWNVTPGLIALFTKYRDAKKPVELHVYDSASGAIGMTKSDTPVDTWLDRVIDWLAVHGFAPKVAYTNVR